jgi:hypothetical protein
MTKRAKGQMLRFAKPQPRAAKPPPCEPRPKRERSIGAPSFCEASTRYCATDPSSSTSIGKWDTRMVLIVGLLVLVAFNGKDGKSSPPQITPGATPPPLPRDRQPSLPYT